MSKHTAGDWQAILNGGAAHGDIESARYIIAHVDCRYGAIGEPEANANLIAAAPDLLEALETFRVWLTAPSLDRDTLDGMYDIAQAAIAKARGQEVNAS